MRECEENKNKKDKFQLDIMEKDQQVNSLNN